MQCGKPVVGLRMIRKSLEGIPQFLLLSSYSLRRYQSGDEKKWLAIQRQADVYNLIGPGRFRREFGSDEEVLQLRQCYLCDGRGEAIGTATAWYDNDYRGRAFGRVHWVAIVPAEQGKGLAKPLMTAVCNRLVELGHQRAYLTTANVRLPAICLYLKFGFLPQIDGEADLRAWREVREALPPAAKGSLQLDG